MKKGMLVLQEEIQSKILLIRGQKVMIDSDLAIIYRVTTKRLNEQVKRNIKRFPPDFMYQINKTEKVELVANCDHLKKLKFSSSLPHVFTEHGAIMLASVLNSEIAVETSIKVVRAFIMLRELSASNKELSRKIEILEKKYDKQFRTVFEAIKQLMQSPSLPTKRRIGF